MIWIQVTFKDMFTCFRSRNKFQGMLLFLEYIVRLATLSITAYFQIHFQRFIFNFQDFLQECPRDNR